MPQTPLPNQTNTSTPYYQAPLEANSYVPNSASVIPKQPIDLYGLMGVIQPQKSKLATRAKTPYELMMEGTDPFATLMPDVAPIQTSLRTIEPLDDPAGLFHSQDGFGKYGYSSILAGGDNENRYAQNFRRDNPDLFFQPGFHPWDGLKKAFYWGGGFLEKTLESAVVKTGQGLAGLYGMTVGNVFNTVLGERYSGFDDWLSKSADNVFSTFFNNWDENLKQRYHYFQEKNDRERKGFVESLGDGDFWMNDISDGLGFLASSMFEAGLISKLGLGTKAATRLAPLAEGVSTQALAVEGAAMSTAGGVGRLQTALNALGFEGSGNLLIKNAVDLTTQVLALTAIESAVEAKEVKDRTYESFEGKINPETGFYYTEDEKQRLSAAAAGQTFKQNMSILAGPKFLEVLAFNRIGSFAKAQMNKAFGQMTTESGRASGAVRSRLGTLSSGTTYNKASALANTWKIGSLAALGFVSEGLFEENIQLAISRTAEDTFGGGDEYYRPGTSEEDINRMESEDDLFGAAGRRYLNQTRQFFQGIGDDRFIDDELSKSIGIGGLFGLVGGAVHGSIGVRQQAKVDNFWNNRLNAATSNLFEAQSFFQTRTEERPDPLNPGKTKPTEVPITDPRTGQPVLDENKLRAFLNKMNNIQGIMDIISNTEDTTDQLNQTPQNQELNKLARNVLFSQLAMEYIRAGKKDLLLQNLTSSSQFSDKDIQALGYQPGMMSEQDKKNMLTRMVNMTNRLSVADEWIENNVLDNVSEPRQGKFGLQYTKTQREKRRQEFEAKKAYLRGLALQNVLLDSYLDDINQSEETLSEPIPMPEILSSVLDENGVPVVDLEANLSILTRSYNSRIPALRNQISVLEKEFAYHWDNMLSRERTAPRGAEFDRWSKSNNGMLLLNSQIKAQEALERLNNLQSELDELTTERDSWLRNNENFELRQEDNDFYVLPRAQQRNQSQMNIEQIEAEKIRRINGVKREEIAIQKSWIEEEWRLTAALKEPKTTAGRDNTLFSRRMSLSRNAYNTYFQREVMDRDNSLGQRKMKLYDKDESKRVNAKKYKANEQKLLKSVRIQGKVQTILAEVNGQKLISEINALLERELPSNEFTDELTKIIDIYNGKLMVISNEDKNLVDDQIDATQDEYNFVNGIFEYMPMDDRFNDKYYELDNTGNYIIKPEYDGLAELAQVSRELSQRIDDLNRIKAFLNSIPTGIPGDWSNPDVVRRRIANVYFETADSIIDTYNSVSNNGQSEISGDSLSSRQDLDLIDQEIDELEQLKVIFNDRTKTDAILALPEFQGFIEATDTRIEKLKEIREKVKERLSSRLRENQQFLEDAVNSLVEQLGVNFQGETSNPPMRQKVESVVGSDIFSKLMNSILDLQNLINKEDKEADDRKAINDYYWTINGQVSAIQEITKRNGKDQVNQEIDSQKQALIRDLQATNLMQKIKGESYYNDINENINDSLLGALQILFYQSDFSLVGVAGNTDNSFLDDQPSSPVYKFREHYNLRRFLREVERDNSRTPDNSNFSKEDLEAFLNIALKIEILENFQSNLNSSLNLLDQVEREREVVQAKIDRKDNKYDNLIVPSVQQLFFIRKIASFLRTERVQDDPGFRNWIYIQAPGGAGKTQTLGTWFNLISGIPRDRVLATAFTEEAARGIKRALLIGEEGPQTVTEISAALREFTKDKNFDHDVLIIDEFPAIDVVAQRELFQAVSEYTKAKKAANKGEFKIITMGDTNQLTFNDDGSISPRPSMIINPHYFNGNKRTNNQNHPAKMTIIPSLTVNFRSNIFAVTSFIDQFKGSNTDNVNAAIKVTSTNSSLDSPDIKGVVSIDKASFQQRLLNYLRLNQGSTRTKTVIVNESKVDTYKKLLRDNGITVLEDPNDELTKGVYVTSVKNVQGFSFDEVFIDLENNDRVLFSGTNNPNYIYNKAMYVAASRARNLIVVTNFPNFENVEDQSIEDLENKSLSELQTKDTDFLNQRDLEINGSKDIMGNEYNRTVATQATAAEPTAAETPLDQEPDVTPDEQEELDEEEEIEQVAEENNGKEPAATETQDEVLEEQQTPEGSDEARGNEVLASDGLENNEEDDNTSVSDDATKAGNEALIEFWNNVGDQAVTAYNKVKDSIVDILFPTGSTVKFKIADGVFRAKLTEGTFENAPVFKGNRVIIVPFRQSQSSNSPRVFGYAVITPALDSDNKVIPNTYRTVGILSDTEIDRFKEKPETANVYNTITENEKRNVNFVSLTYEDVKDPNGFVTNNNKIINELIEGTVAHASPLKYFYRKDKAADFNKAEMERIIETFVDNMYGGRIIALPPAQREAELTKIKNFYKNAQNAQIIIPIKKDVEGPNPRLKIPPELRGYIRPGRPYLMLRPFDKRASMQFIALSRKHLNRRLHNNTISPIWDFVNSAKMVRADLKAKGITGAMGYSRTTSNILSRVSAAFIKDQLANEYKITIYDTVRGQRQQREITFSNTEARRLYNMYSLYSEPNTQTIKAQTEQEIKNLTKVRRARNYFFEDGETIYGTIESYDPTTKTFEVKDIRSGEIKVKSGVVQHTGRSTVGITQQTLDDLFNSNGDIARRFVSSATGTGFVTNKNTSDSSGYRGYKFMALLGSKAAPVPKSYNQDGTVKDYYSDVIEILEDLINFGAKDELPAKQKQYIDETGQVQTLQLKFRVPVPLNARNESGELEHDYSFSEQNTSRDKTVPNSRYFESYFENLLPTKVAIEFTEEQREQVEEQVEQEQPAPPTEVQLPPQNEANIEPLEELTREQIQTLPFAEIRSRLTEEQSQQLDTYAKNEGFQGVDHFFETIESNHPEEQEIFRDYIIECLL